MTGQVLSWQVRLGGAPLTPAERAAVISFRVEAGLDKNTVFTLELGARPDAMGAPWVDDPRLIEGAPVELHVGWGLGLTRLILGDLTQMHLSLAGRGAPTFQLTGHGLRHRLQRGTKSKAWEKARDSDVAREIALDAHLTPVIEDTTELHDEIVQYNQTDLSFLEERAARLGFAVWVDGQALHMGPSKPSGAPIQLGAGPDLLQFTGDLNCKNLVDAVTVPWSDETQGRSGEVTVKASALGEAGAAATRAASRFGSLSRNLAHENAKSEGEARALAMIELRAGQHDHQRVSADVRGDPRLTVGAAVHIRGVAARFDGTYVLESVTHQVNARGYTTSFSARSQT